MRRTALLLGMLLLPASILNAAEEPIPTLALGASAPDFRLPGVDGKDHALGDFADSKYLVVVFTCNHCPAAQAYEGRLNKIVADYKDKGVAVVAISPNDEKSIRLNELGYTDLSDSFDEMKVRAKDKNLAYPYLYDGDRTGQSRKYGPTATPHAFLFDADRKLRYVGRIDNSEREELATTHDLRDALDTLIAGREVAVGQTKAFGCSIKWAGKAEAVQTYMAGLAALPVTVSPVDVEGMKALRKNDSDKLRLVNFWATWCGPCIAEMPDLVAIHRMYGHRAFEMVTVAANFPDEKDEVLNILKQHQASGKNLMFGDTDKYKLMEAFDPHWNASLPYTMLIAPGGEVIYQVQGPIDSMALKRAIVKSMKDDRGKNKKK